LFVYFFAAWTSLLGLIPAAAEPVFPTGLRIGLEPAGDLKLAHQFPGFEDPARNVTVTIFDLPSSAFHELETAAFNSNQLANVKRESFPFANGIGFLISGSTQQNGVTMYRWSLLSQAIGGTVQNLTALVNVQVAESAGSVYSDEVIRKMLASVTFRQAPIQEQLSLLPFKIGDLAGFRVMQVLPTGSVILAEDGSDRSGAQPFMIVSLERGGPAEAGDRATFARDLLATAPVRDLTLQSAESMRVNGLPGYEIRAQGKDPTGASVSVVQWLRFGAGGFLRVIGVSPTEKWNEAFARFRTLRDGIATR
jgi:hypothetical protein